MPAGNNGVYDKKGYFIFLMPIIPAIMDFSIVAGIFITYPVLYSLPKEAFS